MSVYTPVSDKTFSEILKYYDLGSFKNAKGIKAGIENTNYFITTDRGEFVFTIFENLYTDSVNCYVSLLQQLNNAGIPCPKPLQKSQSDKHHGINIIHTVKSKPSTLVTRLPGSNVDHPSVKQCHEIASMLANIHNVKPELPFRPENRRGNVWRNETAKIILPRLEKNDQDLILSELNEYDSHSFEKLPSGIIHSDLFRDNALFSGDTLTGIIDFYDACQGEFIYDIAITINDWCTDHEGKLKTEYIKSFLSAYQENRQLTDAEKNHLPLMLRMAAMRFWLSRLFDSKNIKSGDLTHTKNPDDYKNILLNHLGSNKNILTSIF